MLAGCSTSQQPQNRPPDFSGTVVGRTPRLPQSDGAAHLVIASAKERIDVALERDVRVLEALPDGGYRTTESDDGWRGRAVQVWFAGDPAVPNAQLRDGVVARRAAYVVKAAR